MMSWRVMIPTTLPSSTTGTRSNRCLDIRVAAVRAGSSGPAVTSSPSTLATGGAPGWAVVGSGDTASGEWSPDGRTLLVLEGTTNAPDADQRVLVTLSDGTARRTVVGTAAIWVDSRSFLVWRAGRSYLEAIDSSTETAIVPALPLDAVSNGHGAVAASEGVRSARETFRVWTATGTSAPLSGEPVAWSGDGKELAVWHFSLQGGGTGAPAQGNLEFLAWPSLTRISASAQIVDAAPAFFDPSGRYLAAPGPTVVDVVTGQAVAQPGAFVDGPRHPSELVAWTAAARLVVPYLEGGAASIFDPTGSRVQNVDGQFDSASGSSGGAAVVLFNIGEATQGSAVLRAGSVLPFALPVGVQSVYVVDTQVAVRVNTETGEAVLAAPLP